MIVKTPVALVVFNRPDVTESLIRVLNQLQLQKVYIVADGPRKNRPEDAEGCRAVRALFETTSWAESVTRLYSEENLGCARRVYSGINQILEVEERVIVLEDDCVPHPSFFRFMEEMLERYAEVEQVAMISGDNFCPGSSGGKSYHFSLYPHSWGWATWRRAFRHLDFEMEGWQRVRQGPGLRSVFGSRLEAAYWGARLDRALHGEVDSWLYRWMATLWLRQQLSITPGVNLVRNIGFGEAATHNVNPKHKLANLRAQEMPFPLTHPEKVERTLAADARTAREVFGISHWKWARQKALTPALHLRDKLLSRF